MKFKIDWKIILFSLVIVLAVFLRVYHFSDWLFFKMDQARDAAVVKQAIEKGPGWLPLLGPKAGGTELNLGPAFYYFQYLSAVLFHSVHPAVLAFPDLLFGILSIPLFYLFLRKYFSREWSLILAGLYSVCFLEIQYSRFAWNPNSLVFFNLLYFYSLLNIFDSPRTTEDTHISLKKNIALPKEAVVRGKRVKYKLRWIIAAGLSFAVSTQLHFLSFLTLPVITAIFFWINRKTSGKFLNWKKILLFVLIVILFYAPVFLNEIISKGENTHQFILALKEKPSAHSLWKNVSRNVRYWGQNWFLILTSWISKKGGINGSIISWFGVILPALYLGFRSFRQEENSVKKNFILISLLWFLVYFLAYIPIAYQIRPRFFLPLLALPFVFVGYLAVFFWGKRGVFWKGCVVAALMIIFVGNILGTIFWFREIQAAQKDAVDPWRTIILKAKDGVVLWHLEKAVNYMKTTCPAKKIYYDTSAEYRRPIKYLLDVADVQSAFIDNMEIGNKDQCVFNIRLTRTKKIKLSKEINSEFKTSDQQRFGALSVYQLSLKEEFFNKILPSFHFTSEENPLRQEEPEKVNRIFLKDVWK